jgi:hypothetical protein
MLADLQVFSVIGWQMRPVRHAVLYVMDHCILVAPAQQSPNVSHEQWYHPVSRCSLLCLVLHAQRSTHERKVPWDVRMGSSTLLPVSASTTVDRAMDGAASSMMWSHSSAVMKLWYSQARGLQDRCSILRKHCAHP